MCNGSFYNHTISPDLANLEGEKTKNTTETHCTHCALCWGTRLCTARAMSNKNANHRTTAPRRCVFASIAPVSVRPGWRRKPRRALMNNAALPPPPSPSQTHSGVDTGERDAKIWPGKCNVVGPVGGSMTNGNAFGVCMCV